MPQDQSRTVGYRQPPVETRYQKGHSGNPSGRPKGRKNFKTLLKEELDKQITIQQGKKKRRLTKAEFLAECLVKAAEKDPRAMKLMVEWSGEGGSGPEKPQVRFMLEGFHHPDDIALLTQMHEDRKKREQRSS